MDDQIEIVLAGAERLDEIAPVWASLHEYHISIEHERNSEIRAARQTWEARRADFEYALSTPGAFMALAQESDRRVVGFAVVHLRANHNWRVHGERFAELETLAVLPGYRGKGIGRRLMAAAYDQIRAEGVEELSIVVVEQNADARRFYEAEGFLPWHVTYFGPIPGAKIGED